jgi:hypothetical protein
VKSKETVATGESNVEPVMSTEYVRKQLRTACGLTRVFFVAKTRRDGTTEPATLRTNVAFHNCFHARENLETPRTEGDGIA